MDGSFPYRLCFMNARLVVKFKAIDARKTHGEKPLISPVCVSLRMVIYNGPPLNVLVNL